MFGSKQAVSVPPLNELKNFSGTTDLHMIPHFYMFVFGEVYRVHRVHQTLDTDTLTFDYMYIDTGTRDETSGRVCFSLQATYTCACLSC